MTGAVVLVLRPQPGADETTAHLDAAGIPARALPVLATEPLPETPALRTTVQDLDRYDAAVFVSPAAVRFGMKWIDRFWPQYPLALRWFAVGDRTQRELAAWGVRATTPEGEASAEGLLAADGLADPAIGRVLLVRGEGGRESLADGLAARGCRVDHLIVHRRRPLVVTLPAAETVAALVASSGDVVEALVGTGGLALAARPILVPSERVADGAREAGFTHVVVADGAGAGATEQALRSLDPGAAHRGAVQ